MGVREFGVRDEVGNVERGEETFTKVVGFNLINAFKKPKRGEGSIRWTVWRCKNVETRGGHALLYKLLTQMLPQELPCLSGETPLPLTPETAHFFM